jgi:hypothetical protein
LPVLLFPRQQHKKYAALSNAIFNNYLALVVFISNVCDLKKTSVLHWHSQDSGDETYHAEIQLRY